MDRLLLIIFSCIALFNAVPAAAAQDKFIKLLEVLRTNGTISDEQFTALEQAHNESLTTPSPAAQATTTSAPVADAPRRDPSPRLPESLATDPTLSARQDNPMISTEGGLGIATYDGAFAFELGGRLFLDAAHYLEGKNTLGDGTEIRSVRLDMTGVLFHDWIYEMEVDFADGDIDIDDAYIGYRAAWPTIVAVGHLKEPFSLEEQTGSKHRTFMERSLVNTFAPGANLGVRLTHLGPFWMGAVGLFGDDFNDDADDEGDEGWGVTGRLVLAPVNEDNRTVHLGLSGSYRETDDENRVRFRTRPESHVTGLRLANTGRITDATSIGRIGAEAAFVAGPFSAQAEYVTASVGRTGDLQDPTFNGWYIQGSWFLTGESRSYDLDDGEFGNLEPLNDLGAVELAARFSTVDLSDAGIDGGTENNVTLGVNWYINPHVRTMVNLVLVDTDNAADADGDGIGDDSFQIIQVRMQASF